MSDELDQDLILRLQVLLQFQALIQDSFRVLEGLVSTGIGSGTLNGLPHHDDGKKHQLEKERRHPLHDPVGAALEGSREGEAVEDPEDVGAPHRPDALGDQHRQPGIESRDRIAARELVGDPDRTLLLAQRYMRMGDMNVKTHTVLSLCFLAID